MKLLLYILIVSAVVLNPMKGTDVGKLIPVEVIMVSQMGQWIEVKTDTGDRGEGATLTEAFENMAETAPGMIYLDTAEYLLTEERIDPSTLRGYLKGNVQAYQVKEPLELENIADFLSAHGPGVQLKVLEKTSDLPEITEENGRYQIGRK